MKDFFGNEILPLPRKKLASHPGRAIGICKGLLIAMVFFMVHALRPGVTASWDLYRMSDSGKWEIFMGEIKSKSECLEKLKEFEGQGYWFECRIRVVK